MAHFLHSSSKIGRLMGQLSCHSDLSFKWLKRLGIGYTQELLGPKLFGRGICASQNRTPPRIFSRARRLANDERTRAKSRLKSSTFFFCCPKWRKGRSHQ